MLEIFDPHKTPLLTSSLLSLSKMFLNIKEQKFSVQFSDGPVTMEAKWLIMNIFLWRPLVRRGFPIEKRHSIYQGLVTSKIIAARQTEIYLDILAHYKKQGLEIPSDDRTYILRELCEIIEGLHQMIITQLGAYHLSVSAFELADLMLHPDVAALRNLDVTQEMLVGITATEEKIASVGSAIVKKLKDKTLPSNVIAPFLELGQLNEGQLAKVFGAIGFQTDASSNIIRKPILTSYAEGVQNIGDLAIESLMAKKTAYYNKSAMPDSSYNNRKQQLLSNTVRRIYPGDCGSTVTIPFHIHKQNSNNVLHKNIIVDGETICLDRTNINQFIGSVVQFRSPTTCRYTDGFCHACGGRLSTFMPPDSVVGIACTIEYMAPASQLVLSLKHTGKTKAITYMIPDQLNDVMTVRKNDIYIRENIDVDKLKIGIQWRDVPQFRELQPDGEEKENVSIISEYGFSSIHYVTFAESDTMNLLTAEVSMTSDGTVPYLSAEFLSFIQNNYRNVTIVDDMIWISLKKFDHINEPILCYVVQSNSMVKYVKILTDFATKGIKNYTTIGDALRYFSEKVYQEIQVNILHLEVVLKSFLVTNEQDYNIPVVKDQNNVMFGSLPTIIPRRSLGALLAYERLGDYMSKDPELYTLPHRSGVFDVFFFGTED